MKCLLILLVLIINASSCSHNSGFEYSGLKIYPKYEIPEKDSIIITGYNNNIIDIIYTGLIPECNLYYDNVNEPYYLLDSIAYGNYIMKYINIFNEFICDSVSINKPVTQIYIDRSSLREVNLNMEFNDLIIDSLQLIIKTHSHSSSTMSCNFYKEESGYFYMLNGKKKQPLTNKQNKYVDRLYQELKSPNIKEQRITSYDTYIFILSNQDTIIFKEKNFFWRGREKLLDVLK